jgi:hypothetical protein
MFPNAYKAWKLYNIYPNTTLNWFTAQRNSQAYRTDQSKLLDLRGNNEPRLDYEYSNCPELFMEKASINLFTYTNDFDYWDASGDGFYTNNDGTGPDGVTNSAAYFNNKVVIENLIFSPGFLTMSMWAKKATAAACTMNLFIGTDQQFFTLTDEWVLYSFTIETGDASFNCGFGIADEAYVWNPQLEESEYSTSSIYSGSTPGERMQDVIFKDINYKNYYLAYFDIRLIGGATVNNIFEVIGSMNDGSLDTYLALGTSNTNELIVNLYNNPTNQVINTGSYEDGIHRVAIKWTNDNVKVFVDGVLEADVGNEVGLEPILINRLDLGTIAGNYYPVRDRIRGFIYMGANTDILPTDAELLQLTSIAIPANYIISQAGAFMITEDNNNIILE